jgi:hypothetical protein
VCGSNGADRTTIDTVPGDISQFAGEPVTMDSQVLGTGGGLPEGELTQGEELAGMVLAEESRRIEEVMMSMAGNYSCVDIIPESSHVDVTLAPGDFRDIIWNQKRFWVKAIQLHVDNQKFDIETELTLLPETSIMDVNGTALYSETEFIEYGSSEPKSSSFSTLISLLDKADEVEVPGLMGGPDGTVQGPDEYHVYVRLYGDSAQTVLAENDGLKAVADRPVTVKVRNKRSAKQGSSLYSVSSVRRSKGTGDYQEGSSDYDRAYVVRTATFCLPYVEYQGYAPSLIASNDLVMKGARAYIRTGSITEDIVLALQLNGVTFSYLTIAAGDSSGTASFTQAIEANDRLDLYVYGEITDIYENLTVAITCYEYGV